MNNNLLFAPNSVFTKNVIISTKEKRGDGKTTPLRYITQVYTLDGILIAEYDPMPYKCETSDTGPDMEPEPFDPTRNDDGSPF